MKEKVGYKDFVAIRVRISVKNAKKSTSHEKSTRGTKRAKSENNTRMHEHLMECLPKLWPTKVKSDNFIPLEASPSMRSANLAAT